METLHQYALLSPWYQRIRDEITILDDDVERPAIQKYVSTDFVGRLLADPRESIQFDPLDDVWTFSVPVGAAAQPAPSKRELLAGRRTIRTHQRKLYQPSHQRFYAVVVELVCDEAGFPLPSSVDRLTVGFVVRRVATTAGGPPTVLRHLARAIATELSGSAASSPDAGDSVGVGGLLAQEAALERVRRDNGPLIAKAKLSTSRQAWHVRADGAASWQTVPQQPPGLAAPPPRLPSDAPLPPVEETQLMWPIPVSADACDRASRRSLWFGIVPTFSGELERLVDQAPDQVAGPKLDDRSTYVLQCFVREAPAPGHEHCPPRVWWSNESAPYRLADFFDPDGTKKRRVRVKLPDLRALAARAGQPTGAPADAGGVDFERPAGSNLRFGPAGKIPTNGTAGGDDTEVCTFAIELLTIVAMFVFSLFLPVVVIVFQLWWLLALRFCWPPSADVALDLQAYFASAANPIPIPDTAAHAERRAHLGSLFGLAEDDGATMRDRIKATNPTMTNAEAATKVREIGGQITGALASPTEPAAPPTPETKPADPLCQTVALP